MAGQHDYATMDVNADGFMASLRKALNDLHVSSGRGLVRLATMTSNKAKNYAPVRTGRLRASITTGELQTDWSGLYIDVGVFAAMSGVTYAQYMEYGTSKMAAQPFMRPALAEAAAQWASMTGQAYGQELGAGGGVSVQF